MAWPDRADGLTGGEPVRKQRSLREEDVKRDGAVPHEGRHVEQDQERVQHSLQT